MSSRKNAIVKLKRKTDEPVVSPSQILLIYVKTPARSELQPKKSQT